VEVLVTPAEQRNLDFAELARTMKIPGIPSKQTTPPATTK
jgi:hypothetical protein